MKPTSASQQQVQRTPRTPHGRKSFCRKRMDTSSEYTSQLLHIRSNLYCQWTTCVQWNLNPFNLHLLGPHVSFPKHSLATQIVGHCSQARKPSLGSESLSFIEPSSKIFHSHRRLRQCGKDNGQPTHERQVHCLSSSQDQDLGEDILWDSSFSPNSSVRETWWNPWFPGGNVGWKLTCGSGQRSEVLLIPGDSWKLSSAVEPFTFFSV